MNGESEIREFIQSNIVPVKEGERCIDGRYLTDEGTIARPGGDFGYIMILLSLRHIGKINLSPQEIVHKTLGALTKLDRSFHLHSDTHTESLTSKFDKPLIGCGHIAQASINEKARDYLINPDELREALNEAKRIIDPTEIRILSGEHKEKGVLVVSSNNKTVRANNGHKMFFVYDRDRDLSFQQKLLKVLNLPGISIEDFHGISDQHLKATLRNLAKGLPMYEVNVNGTDPEVKFIGKVGE